MGVQTARERHSSATEKSMSSQSCRISTTLITMRIIVMTLTNGDDDLNYQLFAIESDNHDDDDDDTCDGMMMMMMTVHRLFAIESACRNLYKDLNHLEENLWRWLGFKGWQFD